MPKAATTSYTQIGSWLFIVGLVIALIAAIVGFPQTEMILVLVGLVVGFMNINSKEATSFLIASIALIAAGTGGLTAIPTLGGFVGRFLMNLITLVSPAAIVVAIKAVYALAKS